MSINDLLQPILNLSSPLRLEDSPQTIAAWDSLAQIHIISAIEEIIGKELSTDEVLSLTSVESILKTLQNHGINAHL